MDYYKTNHQQTITCTIGIPGCGKSTWANAQVFASMGTTVLVERDKIRAMNHTYTGNLWDYKFSKAKEKAVTDTHEQQMRQALAAGKSVIVSDTNLNVKTRARLAMIAVEYAVEITWQVFDIPLHVCMKQNLRRPEKVPESVLIGFEKRMRAYLGKYVHAPAVTNELGKCVIFDIDGTLADMKGIRGPFEWDRVGEDRVIQYVVDYIKNLYNTGDLDIIIFSGRDGSCEVQTRAWLRKHDIHYDGLYMRTAGDQRNDSIIKEELFDKHIKGKYHVSHIVDDRAQVCKMWESMGFSVMNVGGFLADF